MNKKKIKENWSLEQARGKNAKLAFNQKKYFDQRFQYS